MKKLLIRVLAAAALFSPSLALADDTPVETQIVDVMNKLFGVHPGFRANHAKGIVVEGTFKPSAESASLSRATLFSGGEIPITARFSDATGVPNLPDGAPLAKPHGIAIKFHLRDGSDVDIVINALKLFPVATPVEFRDLLQAILESPENAPKPTKLEHFIATHPAVVESDKSVMTPDSFAHEDYFGVNAFVFVSKDNKRQAFRWHLEPEESVHLDPAEAAKRDPDFLVNEIQERLKKGPVTFHLKAQLAAPGDPTNDATKPWPSDRKVVDMGVVTLTKAAQNSLEAQKALLFLPGQLADGIEQSDDPLIDARNNAYAVSFSRRSQ
jgi:catalase